MSVFLYSSSSTRTTKSRIGCQIRISDAFSETSPLNNSLARSRTKFKNAVERYVDRMRSRRTFRVQQEAQYLTDRQNMLRGACWVDGVVKPAVYSSLDRVVELIRETAAETGMALDAGRGRDHVVTTRSASFGSCQLDARNLRKCRRRCIFLGPGIFWPDCRPWLSGIFPICPQVSSRAQVHCGRVPG